MNRIQFFLNDHSYESVIIYVNDEEIGEITEKLEVKTDKKVNNVHIVYKDKTSNKLIVKHTNSNLAAVAIDKPFKLKNFSFLVFLRTAIPLFMMSFCFHMAFGFGPYIFGIAVFLMAILFYVNKDNLILTKGKVVL